jgi:hypothetical protein
MKGTQDIPRGRPPFAETQCHEILRMLREAGPSGASRDELFFKKHFTQCGARIFELEKKGFVILREDRGGRWPTWYILVGEPKQRSLPTYKLKTPPAQQQLFSESPEWYEREADRVRPEEQTDPGPLLSLVRVRE